MNIFDSLDRHGIQNFKFFYTDDYAAMDRDKAFLVETEAMRPSRPIQSD